MGCSEVSFYFHWTQEIGEISILIVFSSSCFSSSALSLSSSLILHSTLFSRAALSSFSSLYPLTIAAFPSLFFTLRLFPLFFCLTLFLSLSFSVKNTFCFFLTKYCSLPLCDHSLTECPLDQHFKLDLAVNFFWTSSFLTITGTPLSEITRVLSWVMIAWLFPGNCVTMDCRLGPEIGQKTNSVVSSERGRSGVI